MAAHLLTISLNYVDPTKYCGWNGKLEDTHIDALKFQSRLLKKGFSLYELKDNSATIINLIETIFQLSEITSEGDLVVIAYSGHGAQCFETTVEEDGFNFDQAWCLFDGLFKDNNLKRCLAFFKKGVRVVLFSDSCHSGSMYKSISAYQSYTIKAIPKNIENQITPDGLALKLIMSKRKEEKIVCGLKYFGGCRENQYSISTGYGGVFTIAFFEVFDINPNDPYLTLYRKLISSGKMPPEQTPTYYNNRKRLKDFDYKRAFWYE